MKKRLLGSLLILGALACAASAMAGQVESSAADDPLGSSGDGVSERRELTPEQYETAATIFDMHGERLRRLNEGIWLETTELRALTSARAIDKDDIEERLARIDELREQLRQERLAVQAELAADGIT